jgi:hypothetical protein
VHAGPQLIDAELLEMTGQVLVFLSRSNYLVMRFIRSTSICFCSVREKKNPLLAISPDATLDQVAVTEKIHFCLTMEC